MFALKIKSREKLEGFLTEKTFAIKCFGCSEVLFPEKEIDAFLEKSPPFKTLRLDYLCREEFSRAHLEKHCEEIRMGGNLLVFACGNGVQTLAGLFEETEVLPGCDTLYLNGFQGFRAASADCLQCAECRLNRTAGICPLTACSKSLLNGPCGGAKEGKCEVSGEMDCGWELIFQRLKGLKKERLLLKESPPRDFEKMAADYALTGEEEKTS